MRSSWSLNRVRRITLDGAVASIIGLSCALVLGEAYTRTSLGDAQTAKECRYPPTSDIITEEHVRELERKDMVVIRNVLTQSELEGVRQSARALSAKMDITNHENDNDVRQDQICLVREGDTMSASMPHSSSMEQEQKQEHGDDMIHCIKLLRGIPFLLNRFGYSVSTSHVVPRQCQLARYLPDGSVYVRHLDRCESTLAEMGLLGWLRSSDYRHRTVTAILYLNSSKWESGGNLRCFDKDDDDSVTDVIPTGGTLILFDSSKVEHLVQPSTSDRYALTCWINGVMKT